MNKILLLSSLFITNLLFAQTFSNLEYNNVRAMISDGGTFFENAGTSTHAYEVPVGSNSHTMYSMSFWMYGTDMTLSHHSSYSTYSTQVELAPGPIANDYNSTYYTDNFASSLWTVSQAEIDQHLANFSNVGYVVPAAIADWPGSGNTSEGVAANLAPYYDANLNGIYDPENGDAPYIEGDIATYVIMNDVNAPDIVHGPPLEVEVHVMFYQFATSDPLNNTTFYNVKVHNRGGFSYPDFKFGIFADFDLGNYADDFWGCDSADNYMFVYNGDNNDEDNAGVTGYGANPPSAAIVSLSDQIHSAQTFSSGNEPSGYDSYMQMMFGYQANSAPHIHFDGYETKFQYGDELIQEYSETSLANTPGDRRGLMVVSPGNLLSGTSFCFDYAVVYHRNPAGDNLQNATEIDSIVDFVQSYYDQNIQPCDSYVASTEDYEMFELTIYPNPNNGSFNITTEQSTNIEIYSMSGQLILSDILNPGLNVIDLEQPSGIYMLKALNGSQTITKKIIIE